MRMIGRMEMESDWCQTTKHIPGVENRLVDGISRWPEEEMQNNVNRWTKEQGWKRQEMAGGNTVQDMILNLNLPKERLDDHLWSLLVD